MSPTAASNGGMASAPEESTSGPSGNSALARALAALLPSGAVVVSATEDVAGGLRPGEGDSLARAVPSRVAEFTTGRSCAHHALELMGVPTATIGRGGRGEPLWPGGVVGSITHCEGLRAAAVARAGDVASLGIDAEPHLPLPEGVVDLTLTPPERRRLAELHRTVPDVAWGRVVFSLKEAVYKLWYPLRHEWLGFEEVDTVVNPDGTFAVALPRPLGVGDQRVMTVHGRWAVTGGFVLTTAALGCAEQPRL